MPAEIQKDAIQHVVIVGGGTAGWLTACHLAKKLNPLSPLGVKVTLVESPNIPTIGVGEGTVPAIRESLKYLGISETDFIRECDATFKQSIKFDNWLHNPAEKHSSYQHIFDYPFNADVPLVPHYLMGDAGGVSFAEAVSVQSKACDLGLAPKLMTHREFEGQTNYAYHLDAAKFSAFLTKFATEKLGVTHVLAEVEHVHQSENGDIDRVDTDTAGTISADLYVDCTGFRSRLLGEVMKVPFNNKNDVLFVDHAVAMQIPYGDDKAVASHTISTAQDAGWIWDIGLMDRKGTGYVYSSKYTDKETAETVIRDYARKTIGDQADEIMCRHIPMQVGYRDKFWAGNCVAIGLSQGFVEPLEATGLLIFDATARMLAEQFPPTKQAMHSLSVQFNKRVRYTWDRVIDFIKLHYSLSHRTDTQFWIDNRDVKSIPDSLQEKLAIWQHQPPTAYDFSSKLEIFNLENYLYVLYGMGFKTDMSHSMARYPNSEQARQQFAEITDYTNQVTSQLLPHRELLNRVHKFGFQKI